MAKADGIALRGKTRAFKSTPVKRMAAGGNVSGRDAAMGGSAPGSRAEASRSTSSGAQSSRSTPSAAGRAGGLSTGGGGGGSGGARGGASAVAGGSGPRRGGAALGSGRTTSSTDQMQARGAAATAAAARAANVRAEVSRAATRAAKASKSISDTVRGRVDPAVDQYGTSLGSLPPGRLSTLADMPSRLDVLGRMSKVSAPKSTTRAKGDFAGAYGQQRTKAPSGSANFQGAANASASGNFQQGPPATSRNVRDAAAAPSPIGSPSGPRRGGAALQGTSGTRRGGAALGTQSKTREAMQNQAQAATSPAGGAPTPAKSYPSISNDPRAVIGRTAKGLTQTVGVLGTSKPFGKVNRELVGLLGGTTDNPKTVAPDKAEALLEKAMKAGAFATEIDPAIAAKLDKKTLAGYKAVPKDYNKKNYANTVVGVDTGVFGWTPSVTFGYPKNIKTPAKVTNKAYAPSPPSVPARTAPSAARQISATQASDYRGPARAQPSNLGGTPGPRDIVGGLNRSVAAQPSNLSGSLGPRDIAGALNRPAPASPSNLGGSLGPRDIVGALNRPAPARVGAPTPQAPAQRQPAAIGRLTGARAPTPASARRTAPQRVQNFGASKNLSEIMGKGSRRNAMAAQMEAEQPEETVTRKSTTGTLAQSGTAALKKGGIVRRRDGTAMTGKTKGRYV